MKKLLRVAVACAVAGTMSVVGATSASAHATGVSGVAQCAVDGTIEVSWTIQNDYPSEAAVTGEASGGGNLTGLPSQIAATSGNGNTFITAAQSGIPVGGATASLHVSATWTDGYTASASGEVSLPGECTPVETPATPVAPQIVQSDECDAEGFVTVPSTEGVRYLWDDEDVSGQTLTGPLDGTITAEATDGFVLAKSATKEFPVQVAAAAVCDTPATPATPVAPQIVQSDECDVDGTVTVPSTDGVKYLWDGKDVSGQTLTGPLDGMITVEAKDGFVLAESAKTEFKVQVSAAAVCEEPTTPTNPTNPTVTTVDYSTPTAPTALTAAPADNSTPESSDAPLAYTGAGDVAPLTLLAMGLLVFGSGLVMLRRRLVAQV